MALCGAPQGGALGDTCSKHLVACALSQIVTSASTDLQDYTYYFVPAPWLSVKLLRLLQCYPPPGNGVPLRPLGEGHLRRVGVQLLLPPSEALHWPRRVL